MGSAFSSSATDFVGREPELAELRAGLGDAVAGHGRLFLISGEPGIGKTRLTNRFSVEASELGARVIWGRCWQGPGAPAYWPWVQIVRAGIGIQTTPSLDALLDSERGGVSELLPEFAHRGRTASAVTRLREVPSTNPEEEHRAGASRSSFGGRRPHRNQRMTYFA
jgi:predicted ATPase